MARVMTPQDCHALMNQLVKEATGQSDIQIVDTSDFVSAGEKVLSTGLENTLNALSIVIGRTLVAVRPYNAKLMIINALNTNLYTSRMRKISYYSRLSESSGDFNTQLYTNLEGGFDNGSNPDSEGVARSTGSMWVQNKPEVLEMNFAGQSTWDDSITLYEYQLKSAFRSEQEFGEFVGGIMQERANDIESQKEAFNRMILLNYIGGIYNLKASMTNSVINLTKAFNDKYGTSYTSEELRTTYASDFLKFFTAEFRIQSDYMTERSKNFHWNPTKTDSAGNSLVLLRHTPKSKQKFVYFSPLFTEAKANVFPEIFNPQYIDEPNGEGVTYWQDINAPSEVKVTPAIPDDTTGKQKQGASVELPFVVGILYDTDALMVDYQLESSATTPLEAKKMYRNMFWHFSRNAINDFTENAILFVMEDEE